MRSRGRTLLIVTGIAAGALAFGVFAGMRISSPADAAARTAPPDASDVTVPVELRELESTVVTRGDASYTGAVAVELQFPGLETPPVVTGQVPKVGDKVRRGDVVLEVVGRPVIVLPGDIPMYRSLRPGMSGPDVEQLEKALDKLGFSPGTIDDTYTYSTGTAVAALFDSAGYAPPAPDQDVQAELTAAEQAVDSAEDEVAGAEAALRAASTGPSEAERIAAENEVDQAERALQEARDSGDENGIAAAEAQLRLAKANHDALLQGPDTSAEQAALDAARERLAEARDNRDAAAARASTPLPAAEIVFVPSLPRRVDEVMVKRGDTVDGAVMSISGADLVVTATVDDAARELISTDMAAVIELPTGETVLAPITGITQASGEQGGHDVELTPEDLTNEQVEALRSANVRVTITVASTDGAVLAVPLAALTAGPNGEARVEVQRPSAGEEAWVTELVGVEVGLTAGGYAEVRVVDGRLVEGDLVVVGAEERADGTD